MSKHQCTGCDHECGTSPAHTDATARARAIAGGFGAHMPQAEWHMLVDRIASALRIERERARSEALEEAIQLFSVSHPNNHTGMGALMSSKQVVAFLRAMKGQKP